MTSIPNRFRLSLSATQEQYLRDGFGTLGELLDTARDEERETAAGEEMEGAAQPRSDGRSSS